MKTMPSTLARGWKTSPVTGSYLEMASAAINRTAAALEAIHGDKTMTQAQRSPALADLHRASQAALNKQLNNARNEATTRFKNLDASAEAALHGKLSTVEIAQLAVQLKAMSVHDRSATIAFSADYARAAALAPPALSGAKDSEAGMMTFLKHHEPALLEQIEQVQADFAAIDSLSRHVETGLISIQMQIDSKALETIYKPNLEAIDVAPRANETIAAHRARVGEVKQADFRSDAENPNKETLGRFDGTVGGYAGRPGDTPSAY